MYGIMVKEPGKTGKPLTKSPCRISALSAADYCLGARREGNACPCWAGSPRKIRRLFRAERLQGDLSRLKPWKTYQVVFLPQG